MENIKISQNSNLPDNFKGKPDRSTDVSHSNKSLQNIVSVIWVGKLLPVSFIFLGGKLYWAKLKKLIYVSAPSNMPEIHLEQNVLPESFSEHAAPALRVERADCNHCALCKVCSGRGGNWTGYLSTVRLFCTFPFCLPLWDNANFGSKQNRKIFQTSLGTAEMDGKFVVSVENIALSVFLFPIFLVLLHPSAFPMEWNKDSVCEL